MISFSYAKCLAGAPGLRGGFSYSPKNLRVGNKEVNFPPLIELQQLSIVTSVPNIIQIIMKAIALATIGKGPSEWVELQRKWQQSIIEEYKSMIEYGETLFTENVNLPLVVKPSGGFFLYVSSAILISKEIPDKVQLRDGRIITDLKKKVGKDTFETDKDIAIFYLFAAEVVTVPASGFSEDPTKGILRISVALKKGTLFEAYQRILNALNQVI